MTLVQTCSRRIPERKDSALDKGGFVEKVAAETNSSHTEAGRYTDTIKVKSPMIMYAPYLTRILSASSIATPFIS